MDAERLQVLVQRHLDQVLTRDERAELERMLLASPKARAMFWEAARWHALIRHWGEAGWGREDTQVAGAARSEAVPFWKGTWAGRWATAAAIGLAALTALALVPWWNEHVRSVAAPVGAGSPATTVAENFPVTGVAVLARSVDAEWAPPRAAHYTGEVLGAGQLQLKAGVIQIEFLRGARVVVEGPADLDLMADNALHLRLGRLQADVPGPAEGFSVRSGQFSVIGGVGAFGCVVSDQETAELHVFSGTSTWRPAAGSSPSSPLPAGEGLGWEAGKPQSMPARRSAFLSEEELARRWAAQARQQMEAWRTSSQTLDARPDLLVHLDFEERRSGARTLVNRANHAPTGSGASLVGCDWVEGRWPGKGAVEFKQRSDRLWLSVPHGLEAATFLAWVRVDSLPNFTHALLTAEGPGGKINWSLAHDGALSFGLQVPGDGRGWLNHRSKTQVRSQQLGTWLCLVTVLGADGTVSHYINGEPAGSGQLAEWKGGRLGQCEIGNFATPVSGSTKSSPARPGPAAEPPRNFLGRLDEFSIFSTALAPEEINRLHTAGREGQPPPGSQPR